MDFLFGPQNIDKTTCLIHLANQFIINNKIKSNNGYILLFTPPNSPVQANNTKTQNKKEYTFVQNFTKYSPEYLNNIYLIKCYSLSNFEKSCDLINNFILISQKNKGLKLILIDDLTGIIHPWINEIINNKKGKAKKEERAKIDSNKNVLLIFHQVFQYFLSQISLLQKCYKAQCLISIHLDPSDRIYFSKNSSRIFNVIFPHIRSSFLFQKSEEENQIDFEEVKLELNMKTSKFEFSGFNPSEKIADFRDNFLEEFIDKKEKESNNKNKIKELDENWIKKAIEDFVEKINEYQKKQIEIVANKKIDEDSSFSQV